MSVISTRHNVVPFVSGKTQAFEGQRLAKIGYKDRGKNKARFASVAVSVPHITAEQISDAITQNRLMTHIIEWAEGVQDSVIRSLYESAEGTLSNVEDSAIGIDAIVNFLEAESNGSRLSADKIREWFKTDVADNLAIWVAEKLGTDDPAHDSVVQKLNAFREAYASLSGKLVFMPPENVRKLQDALTLCVDDSADIAVKVSKKLDELSVKPLAELL